MTYLVKQVVEESCSGDGVVWLSVEGATPALLVLKKGREKEFVNYITKLIPITGWRHGNAYAHLTSTLIKTNIAIPIVKGELMLNSSEELYLLETRSVHNHKRKMFIEVHCNKK